MPPCMHKTVNARWMPPPSAESFRLFISHDLGRHRQHSVLKIRKALLRPCHFAKQKAKMQVQSNNRDSQPFGDIAVGRETRRGAEQGHVAGSPVKISSQPDIKVRQAWHEDAEGVANLCAQAFGPLAFRGFPQFMKASETLQRQARLEISKDVSVQLRRALSAKVKAQLESKEYRVARLNSMMQAELRRLSNLPSVSPGLPSTLQRQAMRKWQRNRQFVCLTAVGGRQPEQILGCVVMSLAAPEAFLPPPFPSAAPMRCCISNVAVDGAFRQRGIARRMLRRCETIARRWGYEDIWLHTEVGNSTAIRLYRSLNYRQVKKDPSFFGPFQRILYQKTLEQRETAQQADDELLPGSAGKGTYVWDVSSK